MKKSGADTVFEDIVYKWLHSQRLQVRKDFLIRELTTHEDYPALTALIDFLDLGGMSYQAVESGPDYISEFSYPLLAHVREEGREYMMTVDAPVDFERKADLKKGWTGIVLFPEGKPQWENEENTRQLRQKRAFTFVLGAVAILLLAIAGFLLQQQLTLLTLGWALLSLGGLIFSTMTIATELGVQIKLVHEVCNSFSPQGCDAVLRSDYAKGIWGVSISDMAFSYFGVQFLFLLLSVQFPGLLVATQMISIPLIVVAGVSLYLQKFKLKRWCALCLGIVSVLLLQGILSLVNITALSQAFSISGLIYFLLAQVLLCGLLVPLKGNIKSIREQLSRATELHKWKRDAGLFIAQWEDMPEVDTTTWPEELQYGNPEAPIQITVACSPYCGPCVKAHEGLDRLYHIYKDRINVKVRFVCTPGGADKITQAVTAILRRAASVKHSHETAELLADWFTFMDLDKWQQKWGKEVDIDVDAQLEKHSAWIKEAEIKGTPTIFINGRQLPKRYRVEDLSGLIPGLAALLDNTPELTVN